MSFSQLGSTRTSWAKHHQNLGKTGIGTWRLYLRCVDHQPHWLSNVCRGMTCTSKPKDRQKLGVGSAVLWGEVVCSVADEEFFPSCISASLVWEGVAGRRKGRGKGKQRGLASPWCVPQRCRNQRRSRACCCTRSTAAPSRPSPAHYGSAAPPPPSCPRRPQPRPCAGTWLSLKEPDTVSGLPCQCCWFPVGFLWWGWHANERRNRVSTNCWLTPQRRGGWSTGVHPRSWWDFCTGGNGIFGLRLLHLSRELNQQSVRENTFPTLKRNCIFWITTGCVWTSSAKSPDGAAAEKPKTPRLTEYFPQ